MHILSMYVSNTPPIELFDANELSNKVVVAGPNGVGKTALNRKLLQLIQSPKADKVNYLIIEATCHEERDAWGKATLDTRQAADCQLLTKVLQRNRRRKNLKSSVIQIESNRSLKEVQPFGYSFEMTDPDEEDIGWNSTFQPLFNRWTDTQHAIFRKLLVQRDAYGNRAIQLGRDGTKNMAINFVDPLEPFRTAFESLLAPKKLLPPDIRNQRLKYSYKNVELELSTLSSGEQEVVNIAFDIVLRSPSNCIFFIDEPELHLHPELAYKLIRTLSGIGENNQFIFFSHSADIISSSVDDTVLFMRPPKEGQNQAVRAGVDDDTTTGLRLLGQSIGVISLGKRIVLIEGSHSSTDKLVYGSILGNEYNDFVLFAGGRRRDFERVREHSREDLRQDSLGYRVFHDLRP